MMSRYLGKERAESARQVSEVGMRRVVAIFIITFIILLLTPITATKDLVVETHDVQEAEQEEEIVDQHEVITLKAEEHIIKKGDSLWSISNQYGTSIRAIKEANQLRGDRIITGEVILIPERTLYITEVNIDTHIKGIEKLLEAIYIAEGGANARVPYGATSFHDAGKKFSHARMQYLFDFILEKYEYGIYKTATIATILYYWEMYVDVKSELQNSVLNNIHIDVQIDFIRYLGSSYAPNQVDQLNKYWLRNVLYYYLEDDVL